MIRAVAIAASEWARANLLQIPEGLLYDIFQENTISISEKHILFQWLSTTSSRSSASSSPSSTASASRTYSPTQVVLKPNSAVLTGFQYYTRPAEEHRGLRWRAGRHHPCAGTAARERCLRRPVQLQPRAATTWRASSRSSSTCLGPLGDVANATYKLQFSQVDYATSSQPLYYARVFYPSGVSASFLFSVAQTCISSSSASWTQDSTWRARARSTWLVQQDREAGPRGTTNSTRPAQPVRRGRLASWTTRGWWGRDAWELEGGFAVSNVTDVLSMPQVVMYEVFINY